MAFPTFHEIMFYLFYGIKSPSREFAKAGKAVLKGFEKGMILAGKEFKKYEKIRQKFYKTWYKQNENWADGRHKRKACAKTFVKAFPKYRFYIQMERVQKTCKKY